MLRDRYGSCDGFRLFVAAIAGAYPFRRAARSVPRIRRFAVAVFEGSQRFRFCPVAIGAGIGLFALGRAGGGGGYLSIAPMMPCLGVGHIAAGALLPVVIPIALPCAVFKVVAQLVCGDHIFLRLRGKDRVLKACRVSG